MQPKALLRATHVFLKTSFHVCEYNSAANVNTVFNQFYTHHITIIWTQTGEAVMWMIEMGPLIIGHRAIPLLGACIALIKSHVTGTGAVSPVAAMSSCVDKETHLSTGRVRNKIKKCFITWKKRKVSAVWHHFDLMPANKLILFQLYQQFVCTPVSSVLWAGVLNITFTLSLWFSHYDTLLVLFTPIKCILHFH